MSRFLSIAQQIGKLVERKNAAYGSSFEKAGSALRLLYPAGIGPEQMDDALLIVRVWDKLQRIATDRDALGESPWSDICGYGILGVAMHSHRSAPTVSGGRCEREVGPRMPGSRMPQPGAGKKTLLPKLQDEVLPRKAQTKEGREVPALRKKHRQKTGPSLKSGMR